jgi:serpin B
MRKASGRKVEVMFKFILMLPFVLLPMPSLLGQTVPVITNRPTMAASAINNIGVDLLHQTGRAEKNASLSPYSIETALAMTYAGTEGKTRAEMARVLHLPDDDALVADAFAMLQTQIDELFSKSAPAKEPMVLNVANRLFGQKGYDFRPTFLGLLKSDYNAPFEAMDFRNNSSRATKTINDWVAQQTKQHIKDLIPSGALTELTRLVLVNAVYLKVTWAEPFTEAATKPLPFHVAGSTAADVPTMYIQKSFGYEKSSDVTIVSLPYSGRDLQFLIILPNDVNGLAKVETGLTADKLAQWRFLPEREVRLFLPKFKLEPPTLPLGEALQKLGMTTAFDNPRGSANFDRMAPRRPNDYLYISDVFHKTFVSVDEKGTEAAAATGVAMMTMSAARRPAEPVEVKVDHPFIFAIQHRASGACLFLGHVVDPR